MVLSKGGFPKSSSTGQITLSKKDVRIGMGVPSVLWFMHSGLHVCQPVSPVSVAVTSANRVTREGAQTTRLSGSHRRLTSQRW